jgi:hypothetical protein
MDTVSSRHEGTLGGRLAPLDHGRAVTVAVVIPPDVAGDPAVQHTAWMTINMLARLERVVESVSLSCPSAVPLAGRISPLMSGTDDLAAGIAVGVAAIDTVPLRIADDAADVRLVIGPGEAVADGLRVYGEGWCGGVARAASVHATERSAIPFGPYIGAAIAVGEVFRVARIDTDRYPPAESAFYSVWSHQAGRTYIPGGPAVVPDMMLDETLAGVGAVGCICAHALWAADGVGGGLLLVDGDTKGIDLTNLNRYLLFARQHLGFPKASAARDLLGGSGIRWSVHDGPLETAPGLHRRILCAVDVNSARAAIQTRWPASLLMASTNELRAELVRCDPRHGGPCARCHNNPATATPDEELRRQFRGASPDEQREIAARSNAPLDEVIRWAETGECGTSGERVRDAMRAGQSDPPAFAVPFVSLAAGTMLAAEMVKEYLDAPVPLSPERQHATLQFWAPAASRGASRYGRDPRCPVCRPASEAVALWRERVDQQPRRGAA